MDMPQASRRDSPSRLAGPQTDIPAPLLFAFHDTVLHDTLFEKKKVGRGVFHG